MVSVAEFIDSIERLTKTSKAALKRHVQLKEFGAELDDECDECFKEALQDHLPATLNALQRTVVKRTLQHNGQNIDEEEAGPSKKARADAITAHVKECLTPLQLVPAADDFFAFLFDQDSRRLPVARDVFDEVYMPEILVPDPTGGIYLFNSLLGDRPLSDGKSMTAAMMHTFIPIAINSLLKEVSLPGSELYLRLEYSGKSYGKLSQKLDRPDMLLISNGATVLMGENQDKGHLHEAAENIQEYVRGGFSSLQYGTIDYLPCYAAAGLLVKLGMIHTCGKVQWMRSEFDMSSCKHRALFLFAVINLTRWLTLVSRQLPSWHSRMVLLKPWQRSEHVTITLQSGGRVCKQIKHFAYWMRTHSPGSDLDFVADVYKVASRHPNLVHTHKPPRLALSKRDYEVTLEQYGFSANPTTLREVQSLARDCCAAAAALHAEDIVMRDFRLPNVLTRHGIEGDYVVVDMECAGPDCAEWSLDPLDQWNANTLNQMGQYDKMSDMHQIGWMLCSLPVAKPQPLKTFVDLLIKKQLSATEALQHQWIVQDVDELCSSHRQAVKC